MNRMKKLWAVLLLLVASGQVFADEGHVGTERVE